MYPLSIFVPILYSFHEQPKSCERKFLLLYVSELETQYRFDSHDVMKTRFGLRYTKKYCTMSFRFLRGCNGERLGGINTTAIRGIEDLY